MPIIVEVELIIVCLKCQREITCTRKVRFIVTAPPPGVPVRENVKECVHCRMKRERDG